jgi:hypothetical protein
MDKLTIVKWAGGTREVRFVGYNRDHTACFIRDEQNTRRAITLRLPNLFDLRFYHNPIGKDGSPPIEIKRAALHLPACFATKKEKEAFDDPHSTEVQCARTFTHDLWKAVTTQKCWLEPENDGELAKLLNEELERQRRHFAIREKETADQIAALPPGETKRTEELRVMLRGEFTAITGGENGAFKSISIFDVTLDMVRNGWGGLREKLLEREWAEHFGLKLQTIPTEAAAFHAWLEKHAYNARQRTTDIQIGTVEIGVCLNLHPWQWEVLEAAVLYEVRFADGTRCWLDDIEERAVTSPEEVEDFEKLESAQKPQEPTPWHTEGFVTIRRCNGKGELVENLPLSNEFRALCQLLAERPDQTAQYSEIEPHIGTRTHDLDTAAGVTNPAQKGERRVRDLLRTETGRRLLEWGVLTEIEVGREKFLKLTAPKPV